MKFSKEQVADLHFSLYTGYSKSEFRLYKQLCKKYNLPVETRCDGRGANYGIYRGKPMSLTYSWGLKFYQLTSLERALKEQLSKININYEIF